MKEKLPIDFITNFVSKGWDEVGNLKASSEAIKHEFKDTNEITNIIQDLIDAYLVALGQMELHLDRKDYLDIPTEKELKESLTEDVLVDVQLKDEDNLDLEKTDINDKVADIFTAEKEAGNINKESKLTVVSRIVDELDDPTDEQEDTDAEDIAKLVKQDEVEELPAEEFDYFVDFDDADITKEEADDIKNYRLGM